MHIDLAKQSCWIWNTSKTTKKKKFDWELGTCKYVITISKLSLHKTVLIFKYAVSKT